MHILTLVIIFRYR